MKLLFGIFLLFLLSCSSSSNPVRSSGESVAYHNVSDQIDALESEQKATMNAQMAAEAYFKEPTPAHQQDYQEKKQKLLALQAQHSQRNVPATGTSLTPGLSLQQEIAILTKNHDLISDQLHALTKKRSEIVKAEVLGETPETPVANQPSVIAQTKALDTKSSLAQNDTPSETEPTDHAPLDTQAQALDLQNTQGKSPGKAPKAPIPTPGNDMPEHHQTEPALPKSDEIVLENPPAHIEPDSTMVHPVPDPVKVTPAPVNVPEPITPEPVKVAPAPVNIAPEPITPEPVKVAPTPVEAANPKTVSPIPLAKNPEKIEGIEQPITAETPVAPVKIKKPTKTKPHTEEAVEETEDDATEATVVPQGTYRAIIIANYKYKDASQRWSALKTPPENAKELIKLLARYGFQKNNVQYVTNATGKKMKQVFSQASKQVKDKDQVLICYFGHGLMDNRGDEAFWIATDVKQESEEHLVSHQEIREWIGKLSKARHILILSATTLDPNIFTPKTLGNSNDTAIAEQMAKKSNQAIIANDEEYDDSPYKKSRLSQFGYLFAQKLQQGKMFTASQLARAMKQSAAAVQYGTIKELKHQGGEFVFIPIPTQVQDEESSSEEDE